MPNFFTDLKSFFNWDKYSPAEYDGLVGIFMAHGCITSTDPLGNVLLSSDNIGVRTRDLVHHVRSKDLWNNKPTMLIFQACQTPSDAIKVKEKYQIESVSYADTFVWFSTTQGSAALRDREMGSLFIQTLSSLLDEFSTVMELRELNDVFNRRFEKLKSSYVVDANQSCSLNTIGNTKKFVFDTRKIHH